ILPRSSPSAPPLTAATRPDEPKPSFFSRLLTGQFDAREAAQPHPPPEVEQPRTAEGLFQGSRAAPPGSSQPARDGPAGPASDDMRTHDPVTLAPALQPTAAPEPQPRRPTR